MPRYIDAEKLKLSIIGLLESTDIDTQKWALKACEFMVETADTVDAVEVRQIRFKLHEAYKQVREAFRHSVKIEDKFGVAWFAATAFGIEEAMNVINKLEEGDNG